MIMLHLSSIISWCGSPSPLSDINENFSLIFLQLISYVPHFFASFIVMAESVLRSISCFCFGLTLSSEGLRPPLISLLSPSCVHFPWLSNAPSNMATLTDTVIARRHFLILLCSLALAFEHCCILQGGRTSTDLRICCELEVSLHQNHPDSIGLGDLPMPE